MNKNNLQDLIVVIRSVGERTEEACFALLNQIFPAEQIFTIRATPFSESIRQTFNVAIQKQFTWTLCVDADVLVDAEQVKLLINHAKSTPEHIFQIQGLILDKFFGVWRPSGAHLYRNAYMLEAIKHIPAEGSSMRPETDMLNAMAALGHAWVQCDAKVGIHDFEQYYADIYRKCFLQAHKHKYLIPVIEPYWIEKSRLDYDFAVALMGLRSGKVYGEKVLVDKNFMNEEISEVLQIKKIVEKDKLLNISKIDRIVGNAVKSARSQEIQEIIFPGKLWNKEHVIIIEKQEPEKRKIFERVLIFVGSNLEKTGRKIRKWGDR